MTLPHRLLLAMLVIALIVPLAAADAPDGAGLAPAPIVLMDGKGVQRVFITEKATQRFFIYEWKDGRARLAETLPCTTGKSAGDKQREGDLKTPEGVYRFLRYIDGSQLPPLYGSGAFVMDYPNPFDVGDRKTGGGIWMHGVETDDRVHHARDTRGCVALRNPDVTRLRPWIRMHDTPIVVVERLTSVSQDAVARDAGAMRAFIESWRHEWESKDLDAYLRRYDASFMADGRDLRAWERRKRELAREESERRIGIDELVVLREKDRWWVTFRQEYLTAGHRDAGRKTLFIRGSGPSDWRIISERWTSLDTSFRLVDPAEVPPRMTPELVAAIAPDAAPSPRPALEPEPAAANVPPPAPEVPPAVPEAAVAAAVPGDAAPVPADAAPAPVRRERLGASLMAPSVNRRTYQLLGPHVQRQGESLFVQVQLLSLRATSLRNGALIVTLPTAPGAPAEPPRAEPFTVKQGRLIALSLPDAELPLRIGVQVRDDAGKLALEQELVIEALP